MHATQSALKNETLNHHLVCATKKSKIRPSDPRTTRMRPQNRPFARAPARPTLNNSGPGQQHNNNTITTEQQWAWPTTLANSIPREQQYANTWLPIPNVRPAGV
eukprot:814989-Prymnesium_polylepis.2